MSATNLNRLFAANTPLLSAQEVFSDRQSEQQSFDEAVSHYCRQLIDLRQGGWDAQDLETARTNVLVFYGIGGIGKSTLLRHLTDRLNALEDQAAHWKKPPVRDHEFLTVSYDFRAASEPTMESLALVLRAGLAKSGERFTAFDLLLGAYWEHHHPNQSLTDLFRHDSRLSRFSDSAGIPQHIEVALGDAATAIGSVSVVGVAAAKLVRTIVTAARGRHLRTGALASCKRLEELLASADPDAFEYSPHALAWDLQRIQRRRDLGLVVFLDTVEDARPEMVRRMRKLIWLLPNVLFVIGGRNRLRWADAADGELVGASVWPGLATDAIDDPRQHLVGHLADEDAMAYLRDSVRPDLAVPEILTTIVSRARGLPLYLDLAVQHLGAIARHRRPESLDFEVGFSELAIRIARDLTTGERQALYAACLFDAFDVPLVQVASGLAQSGPVLTLCRKSLVTERADLPLPYVIHSTLRQALLDAHFDDEAAWTYGDFKAAGDRALTELKRRADAAPNEGVPFFAGQAFRIARTFQLLPKWLPQLARRMTDRVIWDSTWSAPRLPLRGTEPPSSSWVGGLADGLEVVMGRQERARASVAAELAEIINRTHGADDGALDILRYFCAEAWRDAGHSDLSAEQLEAIRHQDDRLAARVLHARIHLLRRSGRLADIRKLLDSAPRSLHTRARLEADLLTTEGLLVEAGQAYARGYAAAMRRGDRGEACQCSAARAYALAFIGVDMSQGALRETDDLLSVGYWSFAALQADLARLVARAEDENYARQAGAQIRDAAQNRHSSISAYLNFALAFAAMVRGDGAALSDPLAKLAVLADRGEFTAQTEVVRAWAGVAPAYEVEWSSPGAISRWQAIVAERRERGAGGGL